MKPNVAARFWSRVHGSDHKKCWLWRGSVDRYGYGKFSLGYATVTAHKFAYEHMVHDVPAGLELDHLCRTPLCVNPWHLEPVTHRVNVARRFAFTVRDTGSQLCMNGHPRDQVNLYLSPAGEKRCRSCNRAAQARSKARKRASS